MRVHAYNNPTNRCAGHQGGCCDGFSPNDCDTDETLRSDNEFFFCVRPLNTPIPQRQTIIDSVSERRVPSRAVQLQCLQPPAAIRTNVDDDAGPVNSVGELFLGMPNPMVFPVASQEWEVSREKNH